MSGPEVKTKLTIDDQASKQLEKIKSGFHGAGQAADTATGAAKGFIAQIAAVAIGVNIGNVFGGVRDAIMASGRAALEADRQFHALEKSVAGLSVRSGQSIEQLDIRTKSLNATMEKIARTATVSRSELISTFSEASKNTILTQTQLTAFIGKVAGASRALPAPINEVVAGFEELRKNMVSGSNPVVQMIKQAGIWRGHNERIVQQLTFMGREGKLRIANQAFEILAKRAKEIPPTLDNIISRFDDMKTDVLRTVGTPMLRAMLPALEGVFSKITEGRGDIEAYARMIGVKAGEWILGAAVKIQKGFEYLRTHADEIKTTIVSAFETAQTIFGAIVDNAKPILYGIAAAKFVAPAVAGGIAAGGTLAAGGGMAGLAGTIGPQVAFTAAVIGTTMAMDQFAKLMIEAHGQLIPELGEAQADYEAQLAAIKQYGATLDHASVEDRKAFDAIAAAAYENASKLGLSTGELGLFVDGQRKMRDHLDDATAGMRDALATTAVMYEGFDVDENDWASLLQSDAVGAFAKSFNAIVEANDTAALESVKKIVHGATRLQDALIEGGSTFGISLAKLADVVGDTEGDFREKLLSKAAKEAETTGKKSTPLQFNGAIFNIKQDFRDQDPDRVAVVFQRDIQRAAENRIMAMTVRPFG